MRHAPLQASAAIIFPRAIHGIAIMTVPLVAPAAVFLPVLRQDCRCRCSETEQNSDNFLHAFSPFDPYTHEWPTSYSKRSFIKKNVTLSIVLSVMADFSGEPAIYTVSFSIFWYHFCKPLSDASKRKLNADACRLGRG
jgi:hypothetical protein